MYIAFFYSTILLFSTILSAETLTITTGFNTNEAQYLKKMTQEAFDRAKIELNFEVLPNKRSLVNANSGIADGEAARIWSINKAYPNLIPIAPNIHAIDIVLISKKNIQIKDLSELQNYTIGLVRGVKITNILAKQVKPQAIKEVTNYEKLIKMLTNDRVDFVIVNKIGMFTGMQGIQNQTFYMRKEPLKRIKVYMQLNKKNKILIPKFEKAFESIHSDGTYQKRYDTFMKKVMSDFSKTLKVVVYD